MTTPFGRWLIYVMLDVKQIEVVLVMQAIALLPGPASNRAYPCTIHSSL